MFYTFKNQVERRQFGGTGFIELQYCKLKRRTKIKKIVSVNKITHWQDDSLYIYVDDIDCFLSSYGAIFNCGTYNNSETGLIDVFEIKYYSLEQTEEMINLIEKEKPVDYQILLSWLDKAKENNGFYFLGI